MLQTPNKEATVLALLLSSLQKNKTANHVVRCASFLIAANVCSAFLFSCKRRLVRLLPFTLRMAPRLTALAVLLLPVATLAFLPATPNSALLRSSARIVRRAEQGEVRERLHNDRHDGEGGSGRSLVVRTRVAIYVPSLLSSAVCIVCARYSNFRQRPRPWLRISELRPRRPRSRWKRCAHRRPRVCLFSLICTQGHGRRSRGASARALQMFRAA